MAYSTKITKRKFRESPQFNLKNDSTIAAGAIHYFTLDERFKPYNICTVTNLNNSSDIEVIINNQAEDVIPNGNTRDFSTIINEIAVKNIGSSTIAIDEIRIDIRNDGHEGREFKEKASQLGSLGMAAIRTVRSFFK